MSTPTLPTTAVLPSYDDVVEVTQTVWQCYVDADLPPLPAPEAAADLVATVHITGAWEGSISMSLSHPSATAIADALTTRMRLGHFSFEEVLAELINMIGGNIKGLLPMPSVLSVPEISEAVTVSDDALCVDLAWHDHAFRITVQPHDPEMGVN